MSLSKYSYSRTLYSSCKADLKNVKDITYILHVLCTLHVCTKESDFSMLKKSDGWTTDDFTCCNLFCIEIIQDISVCPLSSYKLSRYLRKQLNSDITLKFEASDIIQSRFDSTSSLTSRYLYTQKSIDGRKGGDTVYFILFFGLLNSCLSSKHVYAQADLLPRFRSPFRRSSVT